MAKVIIELTDVSDEAFDLKLTSDPVVEDANELTLAQEAGVMFVQLVMHAQAVADGKRGDPTPDPLWSDPT